MCVLANMKGDGERIWDYEDADDITDNKISKSAIKSISIANFRGEFCVHSIFNLKRH
jgi:hypothetical protein